MVESILSIDDLSPEEQSAVRQLKQRMVGYMDPEAFDDLNTFVRFVRARDLNINAAEAMLKKHLDWRKIYQVDSILVNLTPSEVLKKFVTFDIIGNDKEGSPIFYFNFGNIDSRGILKSARKSDVMKYVVQKLETAVKMMRKESQQLGKLVDKWTMLINFDGLSIGVATHKETLALIGTLIVMYEANYPERLKIAYCINASVYFTMLFNVIKHFISGPTYRKVHIYSKDGWREDIAKYIDLDVLPAFLGGNRTDQDGNPLCKSFITHGGIVPESYFIKKKASLSNQPDVKKVQVSRKSKSQLMLNVTEPETHIEWEFETASRDIGFSVLYKQNEIDNRLKELLPKQRIETNIASETGMLKCDRPGIYIIEFDNSYSWIFQKEVFYKVSVVKNNRDE